MSELNQIQRYRDELNEVESRYQALAERRELLVRFFAVYEALEGTSCKSEDAGEVRHASSPTLSGRPNTARAKILAGVIDILGDKKPHRTPELLAGLKARRIEVGGRDQVQTIARLLSGNPTFVPDRKLGWSLASS